MWIETVDNGQCLNLDLVEVLHVEETEHDVYLEGWMGSGEKIAISRHATFGEGVMALEKLRKRSDAE